MNQAEECIHLLDPATCTICNGKDKARAKAEEELRRTVDYYFKAKYDGMCIHCREDINPGQSCARLATGGIVHKECVEA